MANASLQLDLDQPSQEHRALYEHASRCYRQAKDSHSASLLNQALSYAQQARALKTDHLPTLNLLAHIELQRHNYAAAELWVEQGLQLKPKSINLLYSAGLIAFEQQQLDDAEHYFNEALKISQVATKALNTLAQVKFLQGDFVAAFQHYRTLAQTQAQDIRVRSQLFEAASHIQADFYSEELEQDVLRYFELSDLDHSQLRSLATSLLRHKLRLSEVGCPLELETLASDPLLLASLTKFYFTDPIFERLFITLRQSLLFSCSQALAIPSALLPLISALAHQCWLNEAVYFVSEPEHGLVAQLESLVCKLLQYDATDTTAALPALQLVLMYQPLAACAFAPLLTSPSPQWPTTLSEQWHELSKIEHFKTLLPSLGACQDDVSLKVQQQYNQHPYPRWHSIGFNEPADYASALRQAFPQAAHQLPSAHTGLSVLVAGCGTGRHAIRLAKYFPSLKVTALDLSHNALAYAMLMAEQYKSSIHFIQGDLLNSQALQQQFDVIECSGVLHHLHDPEQGLKALSAQLKPGGVIKIALYSATARAQITALRQRLAGHIPESIQDIRLMREALLQHAIRGDWQGLFSSPDFYSTSACRDLIFHTQEHCFDVLELPKFLASAGLKWLGMLPPIQTLELKRQTGLAAHEISIEHWHWLEQQQPDLFAGMYQFYAIKPL